MHRRKSGWSWMWRTSLCLLFLIGCGYAIDTAQAQAARWEVYFDGCDQGWYLYILRLHSGTGLYEYSWESGEDSGEGRRLWSDQAPSLANIHTADPHIRVELDDTIKEAHADQHCPEVEPRRYVHLIAVLDVYAPYLVWECSSVAVVGNDGQRVITARQTMPWLPLGGEQIPYSVLILSEYIDPADCTAYYGGLPIRAWYVDWAKFTCLAYLHEDVYCSGKGVYH